MDEAGTPTDEVQGGSVASLHVALARNLKAMGKWDAAEGEAVLAIGCLGPWPSSPLLDHECEGAERIVRECDAHAPPPTPDSAGR